MLDQRLDDIVGDAMPPGQDAELGRDLIDVEVVNRDIKTETVMLKWLAVALGIEGIQPPPARSRSMYWRLRRPRVCRRSLAGVGGYDVSDREGLPSPRAQRRPGGAGAPLEIPSRCGGLDGPSSPPLAARSAPGSRRAPVPPSPRVRCSTAQPRCISSGSSVSTRDAPPSA